MPRLALIALATVLTFSALSARADLEVFTKRDTIVLEDGTEIACRVLMITAKGVLIVESDPASPEKKSQRIVPREQIRSIIRDERNGAIEGLSTETELARKVIKGVAAHKDDAKDDAGETKVASKPTGSKTKSPFADSKKPGPGPFADTTPAKTAPAAAPAGGKDVKVEMPKGTLNAKDLTDAYFSRYPELRGVGMDLLGASQIQEWVNTAREGNESARKPLESVLKAYIGIGDKEAKALGPVRTERTLRRPHPQDPPAPE